MATFCSILLKSSPGPLVPESNKLEVKFSRDGGPLTMYTEKPLDSVSTDYQAYSVNSVMIKDSGRKSETAKTSSIFNGVEPPSLHMPSEAIVAEAPYTVTYTSAPVEKIEPEPVAEEPEPHYKDINESLSEMVKLMNNNLEGYEHMRDTENNDVYNNLKLLKGDLEKALDQGDMQQDIEMEPKTVKTIMAYLEHLEYMNNIKKGKAVGDKPQLPSWYLGEEEVAEPTSDILVNEENKDRINELNAEIAEINEQIAYYKESGRNPNTVSELQIKKNDLINRVEGLELGIPEQEEDHSDQLDSLEDQEERLRQSGASDEELAEIEQEESEAMFKADEDKKNEARVKLTRLRNRMLTIESEIDKVSNSNQSAYQLQHLESEKESLINEEAKVISETDNARLKEFDDQLSKINQKEELLKGQVGTEKEVNELEIIKESIMSAEEEIKEEDKKPTEQIIDDMLMDIARKPAYQSVLGGNFNSAYSKKTRSSINDPKKVNVRIDVDGHAHVINGASNQDSFSSVTKNETNYVEPIIDQNNNELDNDIGETSQVTGPADTNDPQLAASKQTFNIKFKKIDSYLKLDDLVQQLNSLSAMYSVSFADIPEGSLLPDQASASLQDKSKLLQKLRFANQVFSKYSSNAKNELEFLTDQLNDLNLSFEGMLGFYDLRADYEAVHLKQSNGNNKYLSQHTKLNMETNVYKNSINNLAKDSNTLISLHVLISQQFESVSMKKSDSGIDEVRKVDMAIGTIKKIDIVKKEIQSVISQMKETASKVKAERKALDVLIDDLGTIGKNIETAKEVQGKGSTIGSIVAAICSLLLLIVSH